MKRITLTISFLAILAATPQARAQSTDTHQSCVDVQIGSARYYDCLNQQMQRSVPQQRPSAENSTPLSAGAPAPAVGTFNQEATHERLGNSFGKSATPQRPPPIVFTPPPSLSRH